MADGSSQGTIVYTDGRVESLRACAECGGPLVAKSSVQLTCSPKCSRRRCKRLEKEARAAVPPRVGTCPHCGETFETKNARKAICGATKCKKRQEYLRHKTNPKWVASSRARCAAWAVEKRGVRSCNMWLRGAPAYGTHLPGGGFEIQIRPAPRFALEQRNVKALHGMLTAILDSGHDRNVPNFALVPWSSGCGWGLYTWSDEFAAKLDGATFQAQLFDVKVMVTFSPTRKLRAPVVTKRGHRRLVIETLTPVVSRLNGAYQRTTTATTTGLLSMMGWQWRERFGLSQESMPNDHVRLEVLSEDTRAEHVQLGGKFGTVTGWVGKVVVDANAVGEWLLRVAALTGLGGRAGFGFGRVRVREWTEADGEPEDTSGAAGPWFITPHALDRFRERVTGGAELSYEEALGRIIREAQGAHHVKNLDSGSQLWRGPKPLRLRYLVAGSERGKPALVTVLPSHDDREQKKIDQEHL